MEDQTHDQSLKEELTEDKIEQLKEIAMQIFINGEYRKTYTILDGKVTFTFKTRFGEDIYDSYPTGGVAAPAPTSDSIQAQSGLDEVTRFLRILTASLVEYNGKRLDREPGNAEQYESNLKFVLSLPQNVIFVMYRKLVEFDQMVMRATQDDILGN